MRIVKLNSSANPHEQNVNQTGFAVSSLRCWIYLSAEAR